MIDTIEDTEVEIDKLKKPRIKIVGVHKELQTENNQKIEKNMKNRNEITEIIELNIVHKYINRKSNSLMLLAEDNADTYAYIMQDKTIYVGSSRCRIYDDYNIGMYHKCKS